MKKPFAAVLLVSTAGGIAIATATAASAPPPTSPIKRAQSPAKIAPPAALHLPKAIVRPNPQRPDSLMPSEYLPTSALHAGMHGYGLSVFRGNKIERFDVAILGVVHKVNNGRDLILVKLSGPNMIRSSNFIEGMSGSPVYVNGKIVGAVSMSFQFVREPIGFLTPITDMLDAWDPALPQSPDFASPLSPSPKSVSLAEPITIDGHRYARLQIARPGASVPAHRDPDTLVALPCMTRLSVAGVPSGARFERLSKALHKLGLDAQEGPGASPSSELTGSPFIAGGGIGVSLMTGDIDMTGIGTLTYRRGSRIVAFGHPFLGVGPIDAPMYTVFIHDIFPSYEISFKEGSPVDRVGAISQDLPFSIGGVVGAKPKMVPITVHVDDKMLGRDRVFHAQIIRHPQLTPVLAPTAADTAIANVHGQPGDAMATVTTEVDADDIGVIRRTNRMYDASAIDQAAIADLDALVGLLSSNPYYPVGIRSINMTVTIEKGRQTAQVERIFLKQTKFEPGDTVDVGVVLKPYKQDRIIKTLQIKIPPTIPAGTFLLTVQGGTSVSGGIRIGGFTLIPSGGGTDYSLATNVRQMVQKFEEKDRNDALTAHLALPNAAVSVGGEKLSDLPPNLDSAMRNGSRSSGVRLERDEVKVSTLTPYVLSGAQTLAIRVVRPDQPADSGGPVFPGGPSGGPFMGTPPAGIGGPGGAPPGSAPGGATSALGEPDDTIVTPAPPAQPVPTNRDASPVETQVSAGQQAQDNATIVRLRQRYGPGSRIAMAAAAPSSAMAAGAVRAVGRQPGIWKQDTASDFRLGKLDGVTVTSTGDIRLAPRLTKVVETNQPYFWSLAEGDAGSVYAGGGDTGIVYRVGADGKPVAWARTGELEVQSLVRGADGIVYAGTAPHGRVLKIGPDGKPTLLFQTQEKYVLGLAFSPDGATLYAATGGPTGRVYAIPLGAGSAKPTTIYDGPEVSVSALTVGPDGSVYAGTAPNGLVVKIAPPASSASAKPTVLYDATESSISGLAVAADGTVYAVTAPRGVLYRIDPAAGSTMAARVIYDKTPNGGSLAGLQIGPNGMLYTASGSTVIAVDPRDETVRTFESASDIQILSLLRGAEGQLWVGTGNTASVYRLDGEGSPAASAPAPGKFTSSVLDAQQTAQWGTIRWTADTPSGATLFLETRSGNTNAPDSTWSDWSRAYDASVGDHIVSPPGRYLQYQATLQGPSNTAGNGPVLRGVEMFYLTPNQAPQVALLAPHGGEVWRGKKIIRWSGTDPDRDTLSYTLSISGDGGKTWTPLNVPGTLSAPASAPPTKPNPAAAGAPTGPTPVAAPNNAATEKAVAELEAELSQHPEIGPEMRDRILADAPTQVSPIVGSVEGSSDAAPEPTPDAAAITAIDTRNTTFPLDTTGLPDGAYLLRVVATDKPSNPVGSLTDEKTSGTFRIANRPPTLVLLNHTRTVLPDLSVRLEGIALHPTIAIRGVQYRVDGGEWLAAAANDGIFDSPTEAFTLTTAPLKAGVAHTIEVQAQDEAGNTATQKTVVPAG